MIDPAKCQCIECFRYLSYNRPSNVGTGMEYEAWCRQNKCSECVKGGIPLARIRGTLVDPLSIEVLALLSEEAGEVVQRNGKINRWGWEADFEGTTQRAKLESELGDQVAALLIAIQNNQVSGDNVIEQAHRKIEKFREDAAGPKQRLIHAEVAEDVTARTFGRRLMQAFDPEQTGSLIETLLVRGSL